MQEGLANIMHANNLSQIMPYLIRNGLYYSYNPKPQQTNKQTNTTTTQQRPNKHQ